MYEAFPLLEADRGPTPVCRQKPLPRTELQPVLQAFRAELEQIGKSGASPAADLANALRSAGSDSAEYLPCPKPEWQHGDPTRDPLVFRMGHEKEPNNPPVWYKVLPFRLQRGPVTVEQFTLFDAHYPHLLSEQIKKYAPRSDCPAIGVHWWDAWVFCRWLGIHYRLPTEMEWEYACRAGRDEPEDQYGVGNGRQLTKADANFKGNMGRTNPAGEYAPNAWGLCDLHGNIWEWCSDWFSEEWYQQRTSSPQSPLRDDGGPSVGVLRVLRGGSWYHIDFYCRAAHRDLSSPGDRNVNIGFRVCWQGE
jgi:formylglycine-generating enzyme required for sulfatase activity